MKYIIHYHGRYEDDIVVEGETIKDIKEKAKQEQQKRWWEDRDCWSEKVK